MANHVYIADNLARLVGVALLGQATYAQLYPMQGAKSYGIPSANDTNVLFFPIMGTRNGALGLAILALSLQGQRTAVGTVIACGLGCAINDAYICFRHRGNWLQHAVGSVILAGLSWTLLH